VRSRLARAYFGFQSLAVIAWWLTLWLRPEWRFSFLPNKSSDAALLGFAPGDVLMLGLLSAAVASLGNASRTRRALAWLVAGATVYGTMYTITLAVTAAAPVIGAVLMVPAGVACIFAAFALDDDVSAVPTSGAR
jgi:hypothetical protein